jgi:hypothetical protein
LQRGIAVVAHGAGDKVLLDFGPLARTPPGTAEPSTATPPAPRDLVPGASALRKVTVHTGQHSGYSRIIFDWGERVGYSLETAPGRMTIVFDRPGDMDSRQFHRPYLKYIRGGTTERVDAATKVTLQIAQGAVVHDRQDERQVILDVLAPSTASAAQTTPGPTGVPGPAPAPAEAAAPQTPSLAPLSAAGSTPETAASNAPTPAAAAHPTAPAKEDAVLRLPWDRPVAAAIFRRGETLWCVFDTPSQQDVAKLAASAGPWVRRIEQQPHEQVTVPRISTEAGVEPRLERDGLT